MGHRLPIAQIFYQHMHCNVFIISYRGYGASSRRPTEKGIKIDSRAGLDYLLSHDDTKDQPIILYGQSLGGAVAVDLAADRQNQVKACTVCYMS